jgi:signal transduction histidine kinase/ActR/RegA family two-component response regulator
MANGGESRDLPERLDERKLLEMLIALRQGDFSPRLRVTWAGDGGRIADTMNELMEMQANLAKFRRMLQGQKDMLSLARLLLSELAPVVSAQHGAFYVVDAGCGEPCCRLLASYASRARTNVRSEFRLGEGLVGQAAVGREKILLTNVPPDDIEITSGPGEAPPLNILVLPVVVDGAVKAVIELASFDRFSATRQDFLDQLMESVGIVLNRIATGTRAEDLLKESPSLMAARQTRQAPDDDASPPRLTARYRSELLANMSHELRTPLNALRSWAWVLRTQGLPAEKIGLVAEAIERSVAAQIRIVDDLLDVSRIMTGKLSLRLEPLDLRPIVDAALAALEPQAEGQGMRIVRLVALRPVLVVGDGDRLRQVVTNLVSNAVKFTPPGGHIEIGVDADDVTARIRVRDTGCGIAPGFLPHVFERFRQADGSVTRRAGGLGVGLTIVRQLVEMHGGGVTAASDGEGRGATFTVTLPLLDATRAWPPVAADGVDATARLDGARILLVEDDPDTSAVMALVLTQAGASVATAPCAAEAMQRLAADPFDAMLCDIGLPGEDGYSLIRRARALAEPVGGMPALALSAFARDRDRQRARDAGFDGHLAKPVEPAALLRALAAVLVRLPPEAPLTRRIRIA